MDNKLNTSDEDGNIIPEELGPDQEPAISQTSSQLKKCPFCAEMIQIEAIKCRYCGEFLHGFKRKDIIPQSKKWYYSTGGLIILLIIIGPLALPVVWLNPSYKLVTKVFISLILIIYTFVLIVPIYYVIKLLLPVYREFTQQIDSF